jgi:hypothetical protein
LLILALAALAAPAPAAAQFIVDQPGKATVATYADGEVRGSVRVDFHGDESSGCAATGMCGISGTVVWRPDGEVALLTASYRDGGRHYESGLLAYGETNDNEPQRRGTTSARVRRGDALCSDAVAPSFAAVVLGPQRGNSLAV